jgi:hypothetical protein
MSAVVGVASNFCSPTSPTKPMRYRTHIIQTIGHLVTSRSKLLGYTYLPLSNGLSVNLVISKSENVLTQFANNIAMTGYRLILMQTDYDACFDSDDCLDR